MPDETTGPISQTFTLVPAGKETGMAAGQQKVIGTGSGGIIIAQAIQPWKSVAIRVARVYGEVLVGLFPVFLATDHDNHNGVAIWVFMHGFNQAAQYAIGPAMMALITNAVEILRGWDRSNPILRG